MTRDFFAHKADSYEGNASRVKNVDNIARAICTRVSFDKAMHIVDFGSGTGLLLERIAPYVGTITAIDISKSMNQQLEAKRSQLPCRLNILETDLSTNMVDGQFDGIISSMTLHHIEDIGALLSKLYSMLRSGGFLAVADLDQEDGSFHQEDTGVFHNGFDRDKLRYIATDAGFQDIGFADASTVIKPQGNYPVFLLYATK